MGTLIDNPEFKLFIDQLDELEKKISHLPLPEQRRHHAKFLLSHTHCNESVPTTDIVIPGNIPLRIYTPKPNLPTMMYFHGGGWVFGSIEEADAVCRRLANHLNCIIASVGYRLAPEHPFPIPLQDCYAATKWMSNHSHTLLVSGESAGGNLAAAVALLARDNHGPKISGQLLLYPVISSNYFPCQDQYFLTKDAMQFFWDMYAPPKSPYAFLNLADLHNLPPTLLITAEHDPLTHDINTLANRLQQAHVPVLAKTFPNLVHAFLYIHLYPEHQKVLWTKELKPLLNKLGLLINSTI